MQRAGDSYNPKAESRLRSSIDLKFNPDAHQHEFMTEPQKHTVDQMRVLNSGQTQALGKESMVGAVNFVSKDDVQRLSSRVQEARKMNAKKMGNSSIIFGDDGGPILDDSLRRAKKKANSQRPLSSTSKTFGEESSEQPRKQSRRVLGSSSVNNSVGFEATPNTSDDNVVKKSLMKTGQTQAPQPSAAASAAAAANQFGKENLDATLRPKTPAKQKNAKPALPTRMGEEHLAMSGLVPPPNAHHPPVHGVGLGLDHPHISEIFMASKMGKESAVVAPAKKVTSSNQTGEDHLAMSGLVPPPNAHHPPVHGVGLGLDHPHISEMFMASKMGKESAAVAPAVNKATSHKPARSGSEGTSGAASRPKRRDSKMLSSHVF